MYQQVSDEWKSKKIVKKSSNWREENIFSRLILYYKDDNFAKYYPELIFVILKWGNNIKFFLIGCVIYYRIVSLNELISFTEIEWGEHRSEQPRQESFDRWKTKLRRRHGGGRTCRQKIEDLRGSSSIRGDNLRVSGPACTQTRGHPNSVCARSQSRSSSCSLRSGTKNRKKNDIYIINIQPKNTRKERIQWKHTDYTTDT